MKTTEQTKKQILGGMMFATPGKTEKLRRQDFYCDKLNVDFCINCPLVNYGLDCHNNMLDSTSGGR